MSSTELVLVDRRLNEARDAVMRKLLQAPGSPESTKSDTALTAALDAYGIPSGRWHTGSGYTARGVVFDPDESQEKSALQILITYGASVDHLIAHHGGWLAMWHGPERDGYADNEIYNAEDAPFATPPTFADVAEDSARCARSIRDWYDGTGTSWTRNEVSLAGMGPYRCETRTEIWDGYCAPRFTRDVMQRICENTQAAHREREWEAPVAFQGDIAVIQTPLSRTEVRPDSDGNYRPGAFYWPWREYTDRDLDAIKGMLSRIRWRYERRGNDDYTVIAADHGWRVNVIDVIHTPCDQQAAPVALELDRILYTAALSSYEVTANGPGEAAAQVREHFKTTRADRNPDARVQMFDMPGVRLPRPHH